MMDSQLPIQFRPLPEHTFANFVSTDNQEAVSRLRIACDSDRADSKAEQAHLCGVTSCGKSHLLQALCHCAREQQKQAVYLPLKKLLEHSSEVVDGIEEADIVCIDDVDSIAGQAQWEESIFNLINRARLTKSYVLTAAKEGPEYCGFILPDLSSRLFWGGVYRLQVLSDAHKAEAITLRMRFKGDELSQEVLDWLLVHYSRDMRDLMQAVDVLNKTSIAQARRITVPLARSVLLKSD